MQFLPPSRAIAHFGSANCPVAYQGLKIITSLALRFPDFQRGSISLLILLFFVRIGTTLLSYSSGAPGGIFAPMLALGTLLGLWYGHYVNIYFPTLDLQPGLFAIAGMGALFAATVRAPLTGIALSIELTNNYSLILPLILTVATATVTAELLGGKPIYSVLLQRTLKRENNP